MSFRVAAASNCAPCQKWAKREGFVAFPKKMAGVGHLKRICKDAFSVAGAVQETCSSELLGGPGADFLIRVAFWSLRSWGLLRWFCVTGGCSPSYDLASLFGGRRRTLNRWNGKIAKRIGTRPSPLLSTFHSWRMSRRIASFSMLSTLKNGSLADLLCFWCCQVQKLSKSRWIAGFLMLSSLKTEEVSQNSFVFKLADR